MINNYNLDDTFEIIIPIISPMIAGVAHARPILASGSLLCMFATLSMKLTGIMLSFGNATIKSSNAATNVKRWQKLFYCN